MTYQRWIVQSRRGSNTVAVSRLHVCVVGVAGVPVGSRSRHVFIPTQEVAVQSSPQDAVDPGLRVQANWAVRPGPLVRNDLVRTTPTYVEMQEQVLSPGVEDADHTDVSSQVFGMGCDLQCRPPRGWAASFLVFSLKAATDVLAADRTRPSSGLETACKCRWDKCKY